MSLSQVEKDRFKLIFSFSFVTLILVLSMILVPPESMSSMKLITDPHLAMVGLAIFIIAIFLFIAQPVPLAVSSLVIMFSLPYLKLSTFPEIYQGFGGGAFFVILFCFAITASLLKTSWPIRISHAVIRLSKGNPLVIIFGFGYAICLTSGFLSNVSTVIMYFGIISTFLKVYEEETDQKKSALGSCLMIVIAAASGAGGCLTPVGSTPNPLVLSFLLNEGINLRFFYWFILMLPFSLLIVTILCTTVYLWYKPKKIDLTSYNGDRHKHVDKLDFKDKVVGISFVGTIILWFASTWITVLNVVAIAAIPFLIFFAFKIIDWKDYITEVNWNILFVLGTLPVIMGSIAKTGATQWIIQSLLSGVGEHSSIVIFIIMGLILTTTRIGIPTSAAFISVFLPLVGSLSTSLGISLTAITMISVFWSGATMLLVFTEPLFLYTYSTGYYKASDFFRITAIPTCSMIIIMALFFPSYANLLGY